LLLHVAIGLVAIRDQVCSAPSRETECFRIQARELSSEAFLLSSFKNLRHCLSLLFAEFLRVLCGRSLRTPRFKVLMTPGKNKVLIRGDRRETAAEHAETERRCQRIFSWVEIETLPNLRFLAKFEPTVTTLIGNRSSQVTFLYQIPKFQLGFPPGYGMLGIRCRTLPSLGLCAVPPYFLWG
jgi:hypothetical protein